MSEVINNIETLDNLSVNLDNLSSSIEDRYELQANLNYNEDYNKGIHKLINNTLG